ncbi:MULTISPECIES: DNA polymerase III subunit delta [unclassified Arthrobacter]|uniref:DNA polymerase III subunit delta n=1 Tax=unclassified Arthrobacter TaxID=235627 RepID=UPI0006FAF0E7|nr:DNA polymerase III subunit delta [Arthrobacter sp. Leaf234]KQO00902.1 DNA polymerase III subunit delta [Arthrobacter sp. Leaf234]
MATRTPVSRAGSAAQAPTPWRDVRPAAVVLLAGPEDYLASKAAESIRHQVRIAQPGAELVRFDAGTYEAGMLTMHASPSLFGDWKIIEAAGLAQMNDAFLVDALAYLTDPAPDVVLVLRHTGGNRGKKLLDAVRAAQATIVDCQPLKKDGEKAEFVTAEFKRAKRRIDPDAVRALVAAVGSQLPELAAACQQLMADTAVDVTAELVEKYYGGRVEATGFKVADAALAGRTAQALSMLRHALATGADPVPIVAALAMKVRAVAKVHGVRGSSAQLARDLGMAPWQVDQARREAQRFSSDALARAIRALAEADAQVKGESRDPVYAVERAVTVIALGDG